MKDKMLAFLKNHIYCTISTVDSRNNPEAAFVAYSSSNLDIFIGTSNKSRKFNNLLNNSSVALVIADESGEIQYEGQAKVIDAHKDSDVEEAHISKLPGSAKYREDPNQRYIHITPTWIRYTEHGVVDQVEEWSNFS